MQRNDSNFCSDCFTKPIDSTNVELPNEAGIESLIAEYVQLHSDEKRISERLDEIKDLLKTVAAAKQRVAGAVVLRAGDAAVKCSYKVTVKYNTDKVAALESALDETTFAALFDRKVSYAPVKGKIEEVTNSTDEATAALRDSLNAATERTEIASITVVPAPKKK